MSAVAPTAEALMVLLERLARLRLAKALRLAQLNELLKAFEVQHAAVYDDLRLLAEGVAQTEKYVRTDAVAFYRQALNRDPVPGIKIRMQTDVTVTDSAAALAWALEKHMGVKLDVKQVEGVVKAGVPVPGVKAETQPHATIAEDLLTFYPGAQRDQPLEGQGLGAAEPPGVAIPGDASGETSSRA